MSAPSAPTLSVVIVNWNGGAHLSTCLEALRRQTFRDFEIIVVDNGSTDGSPETVARQFPEATLLRQPHNLGFAAANNVGAERARGAWLVLLNNDAFPEPDWLEALQQAATAHPDMSGFASCQVQAHDPARLDGAGDTYHTSGLPWRAGFGQLLEPPWDREREIFIPCAAAAMYRRAAFQEAGGFDERFFCYIEDVDLAFRMQLRGHRFMYVPRAVVHHVGSATSGRISDFARYHGHRNLVWCYAKNMPTALLWKTLPGHLAMNLFCLAAFTLQGEARAIWRAKWDALRGLPVALRQRREIQRTRTASPRELERRMARGLMSLILRNQVPR